MEGVVESCAAAHVKVPSARFEVILSALCGRILLSEVWLLFNTVIVMIAYLWELRISSAGILHHKSHLLSVVVLISSWESSA